MAETWIKLYRKIIDNSLWRAKPFDCGKAWVDLLLHASYENQTIKRGEHNVDVPEGSICRSEIFFAERWGWTRRDVHKFLQFLEAEGMISVKSGRWGTEIRITKWKAYQKRTRNGTRNGTRKTRIEQGKSNENRTTNGTTIGTHIRSNKKENTEPPKMSAPISTKEELMKLSRELGDDW